MRIAIVSDIHGNLTALEAVIADLRDTSPDFVMHGGDLVDSGSSPAEVLDRVRELGWPGVRGNGEELLAQPQTLLEFTQRFPAVQPLLPLIQSMAEFTRAELGDERIAWLARLPLQLEVEVLTLLHASPVDCWRAPMPEADDNELERVYGPLGASLVAYGHIHRPFVRDLARARGQPGLTVANSGSLSLSHDGDPRAAYLLIDDGVPSIRRVEYDVGREIGVLHSAGMPHADWLARSLRVAGFVVP